MGSNSTPVVVDWNNDERKDLLVGMENESVWLFLNQGTNEAPSFTNHSALEGVLHYRSHPEVYDMNGDGKKDLLVGDDSGYIWYYENTNTDADPVFAQATKLVLENGRKLRVNYGGHFDIYDWDLDGSMDIIAGDYDGYINIFINVEETVGISPELPQVIAGMKLKQNYPNPFNPITRISYNIPSSGPVNLSIFSVEGKCVEILVDELQQQGEHSVSWDASKHSTGVYYYQLSAGGMTQVKKCIFIK